MIGFLIGTACLIGLIKVVRRGHHARWGRWGHAGHHYGGRVPFLRALLARLDTTPGQEKVIKTAVDEFQQAARRVRADMNSARPELARAFRQEQFDETLFGELSHKADEAAQAMRRATVDAVAKIHSVLEPEQKRMLADWIESGGRCGAPFRQGGPYRGAVSL
jgi:Spy/CpxP family protein refolding chaperone